MMEVRISLTNSDDVIPLEFGTTVGYLERLVDQLTGERQPIHPCILFHIPSFDTLGPRMGVYLDGTEYRSLNVGQLGDDLADAVVSNARLNLSLAVDDSQVIELQRLYSSAHQPPYAWTTTVPKEEVESFVQRTTTLIDQVQEAVRRQVPHGVECPHCSSRHRKTEIVKRIDGGPGMDFIDETTSPPASAEDILVTPLCPEKSEELAYD